MILKYYKLGWIDKTDRIIGKTIQDVITLYHNLPKEYRYYRLNFTGNIYIKEMIIEYNDPFELLIKNGKEIKAHEFLVDNDYIIIEKFSKIEKKIFQIINKRIKKTPKPSATAFNRNMLNTIYCGSNIFKPLYIVFSKVMIERVLLYHTSFIRTTNAFFS